MGRRQLSGNYADSSPDCRLKLCEKCVCVSACVCVRPLLSPSLSFCVCTSGAQGLLSIGSVWLNVKNCGFLPGASLSGSLPCLHFLNTPLFLNLLQVFGQDVKTHTGPGEQDFSPPPPPSLSLPSLTSNLCPPGLDFFFSSSDAEIKRLLLIMGQSLCDVFSVWTLHYYLT